jgi:hypothetical protein
VSWDCPRRRGYSAAGRSDTVRVDFYCPHSTGSMLRQARRRGRRRRKDGE